MSQIPYSGVQGDSPAGTISVPNDYQTAQATPAAFGAGIGQAEQAIGGAGERLGAGLGEMAVLQAHFERNGVVTDGLNQAQAAARVIGRGDPNDPNDTGYLGLTGKAAVQGLQPAQNALLDRVAAIREGIRDPIAQQMFDRQSRRLVNASLEQMSAHHDQQTVIFQRDAAQAGAALSQQDAIDNYADDKAFTNHLADAQRLQAQADQAAGVPPDMAALNQRKVASDAWAARVNRVAADDPLAAQRMLEANSGQLLPATQVQLMDRLKPQVQRAKIDAYTGQVTGQPIPGAPSGSSDAVAAAIHGQESGGSATSATSIDGARGGWQITPGTFAQYAKPGENIDNPADNEAVGRRIVADLHQRYGGDPARVAVGYFSGPGNVAPAGSATPWIEDKKDGNGFRTSQYVRGVLARLPAAGQDGGGSTASSQPQGAYALPSADDVLAQADRLTAGESLEVQDGVRAKTLAWLHQQQGALHGQQTAVRKQLGDTVAALQDGRDVDPVNEATIRTVFPPEQAEPLVEQQRVAQATGYVTQAMRFASPAERQQMLADAQAGTGQVGKLILGRGAGAQVVGDGGGEADDTANYRLRRQAAGIVVERNNALNQQLAADPALYVSQSPAVIPFLAAASKPGASPDDRAAAVHALMAEQERLGVPAEKRMAMPMGQAAADVKQLQTVDPSKADMGTALQQKAQQYGAAWPEVFGSYVKAGLSPNYQMLAAMDRPDQVADRDDFQRALSIQAEPGGMAKLKTAAGEDVEKLINDGLDTQLLLFRPTIADNQSRVSLYTMVRDSIRTLALYRASRGDDAGAALQSAYDSLIGKRYDFDGTMRVPKGMLPDVRVATRLAMNDLKPEDMPVVRDSTPGLTDLDKQTQLLRSIQAYGEWVPTSADDGLQLIGRAFNGIPYAVTKNGKPVVVKFDDIRSSIADSAARSSSPPDFGLTWPMSP